MTDWTSNTLGALGCLSNSHHMVRTLHFGYDCLSDDFLFDMSICVKEGSWTGASGGNTGLDWRIGTVSRMDQYMGGRALGEFCHAKLL